MGARSRGYTFKDGKLEELHDDIRTAIVTAETRNHIPRSRIVELSGLSVSTFYKCWNDPSLFRIGQLYAIYEGLHVPEAERRYI